MLVASMNPVRADITIIRKEMCALRSSAEISQQDFDLRLTGSIFILK